MSSEEGTEKYGQRWNFRQTDPWELLLLQFIGIGVGIEFPYIDSDTDGAPD